jgi:hypothetical protein
VTSAFLEVTATACQAVTGGSPAGEVCRGTLVAAGALAGGHVGYHGASRLGRFTTVAGGIFNAYQMLVHGHPVPAVVDLGMAGMGATKGLPGGFGAGWTFSEVGSRVGGAYCPE